MTINQKPNFQALENNIIDIIKEEQIKLGYHKETIRLYYPMESINHILGTRLTTEELKLALEELREQVMERLGEVTHSNKGDRFCIMIPPQGVAYVHEAVEEKEFLREFITKFMEHGITLKEILTIFHKYSTKVICEPMTHGEFDYLIYFEDGQPDDYRYCIKIEEEHAIYHRFTKADYESFDYE